MAKQKSIAELRNLQKQYMAQLENLNTKDKRYRSLQAKLKMIVNQMEQIQDEMEGIIS